MKKGTSFRLSETALNLLKKLAEKSAISQTAVLEILIREKAKQENIIETGCTTQADSINAH